ncbi:Hypothetical protein NTJ_10736 [Nesidiocoris tenuis]|uniref:Uncharacterized protein n=1 Tax=Nesidiocoris tenuis TaxID=355587 RepID=A0ABN7B2S8_9HEMI|nr:Hypothetical protein NTJ_10736 [Nesidiocoris tenuis]
MPPDMMDKSVSTDNYAQGEEEWKRVQLEWLLAALVDSKVVAMKADSSYMKFHQGKVKAHRLSIHHDLYHHRCRVTDERYVTLDMCEEDYEMARRKKRKKRRNVGPMLQRPPILEKPKVVDPEDLPKRARWTIIITAGFLLLTCMLLVGITLRMAPIIDQMVHSQNEELMNSLNRQSMDYNGTMLMA